MMVSGQLIQPGLYRLITEFDPSLWGSLLDHATVCSKEDMRYTFKDGTEIKL